MANINPYEKNWKLLENETAILNKEVVSNEVIEVESIVQHNYPVSSSQGKMMISGKFNIANQWLFKDGSPTYDSTGSVIDYSGNGNNALLANSNCLYGNAANQAYSVNAIYGYIVGVDEYTIEFDAVLSGSSNDGIFSIGDSRYYIGGIGIWFTAAGTTIRASAGGTRTLGYGANISAYCDGEG